MADALNKLRQSWKEEMNDINRQEMDLINAQSEIQKDIKKEMIQETAEWTKNVDPSHCYAEKLTGGNLEEMKKICGDTLDFGEVPDLKVIF